MAEIRRPAVAGMFYAGSEAALREQIKWCFEHAIGPGQLPTVGERASAPRRIIGLIAPHAGYIYSGPVAAHAFYEVAFDVQPETVVIIGPNHRGLGTPVAISYSQAWRTPLGEVSLDLDAARQIAIKAPEAALDDVAHTMEHSIEVQLPFLQFLYGNGFRIVPIAILTQDVSTSMQLGEAIAAIAREKNVLIIASTDLTHYESHRSAARKDGIALEQIARMEADGLVEAVRHFDITMCGLGPVVATMTACRKLGAEKVKTLRYATSGETSGDLDHVVGYAAIKIER